MRRLLVAEDAVTDDVLGYAGLLVAADEAITNVAVFPEQRRRGHRRAAAAGLSQLR